MCRAAEAEIEMIVRTSAGPRSVYCSALGSPGGAAAAVERAGAVQ